MTYRCELCGRTYADKGKLIQLSPWSALGCPIDGGECHYEPYEHEDDTNDRKNRHGGK